MSDTVYYHDNVLVYKVFENLPQIPMELLQQTLEHASIEKFDYYEKNIGRKANPRTRGGIELGNKRFPRSDVPVELEKWARENISGNYKEIGIAKAVADEHIDALGPHTDRSRDWTLIYLLSGGGPEHKTVFYNTADSSGVTREMSFDYNEINEICNIQIPIKKWTLLNAQIPHSVENLPGERLAIQIGWQGTPQIYEMAH